MAISIVKKEPKISKSLSLKKNTGFQNILSHRFVVKSITEINITIKSSSERTLAKSSTTPSMRCMKFLLRPASVTIFKTFINLRTKSFRDAILYVMHDKAAKFY